MTMVSRPYQNENDYWRIRNFLQEVLLLNGTREHSWHVARWDYLRWHFIKNCHLCPPLEEITTLWEDAQGKIAAVLHPLDPGEAFIHVHPAFRTPGLEAEVILHAEATFNNYRSDGSRRLYIPVDEDDLVRKEVLCRLGYVGTGNLGWEHFHDLDVPLPEPPIPPGYVLRSMGEVKEHPQRSWASWQAFHFDEPDEDYDGDWTWYANIQRCPLYRRDLDVVAATPDGSIAAFCTIFYDDATRSAVTVLVGTAAPHKRRGLGKAVLSEGMRRLKQLGCLRVFAKADDRVADALYTSVMSGKYISETWIKDYK